MTELLEGVSIGIVVDPKDIECPFHDQDHKCDSEDVKNVYTRGNATTLGENLEGGGDENSVVVRKGKKIPDASYRDPKVFSDPDKRREVAREVTIVKGDINCRYPVGFSAHHLIPAKESLARATSLHKYIDKGESKVCCNLGYNVDGNENGVWLPGLHAVNSKDGVNVWGAAPESLPDNEEVGRLVKWRYELESETADGKREKYQYALLEGPLAQAPGAFSPNNMKWMYVKAAMRARRPFRQFHDRHVDYSKKVEGHLEDVGAALDKLTGSKRGLVALCDECKKRKESGRKTVPPPYRLLGSLNGTSKYLRDRLLGKTRDDDYYTSSWCGPSSPK